MPFEPQCCFANLSPVSDGVMGTSLGARMLQGGVKKGLLLRNMQVEWSDIKSQLRDTEMATTTIKPV